MSGGVPVVYSMSDMERMAQSIVKSGLFGVKSVDQAITLMLVAQAENLHPATAARDYHVIQGRPALKADAMLARFQQAGGKVEWESYTDAKVSGNFSHPQSPKPVLIEWTIEMAKKIGLANKDNWKNYPRAMLRARVISEGVRTCYPAIATGIYTPEEVMDMPKEKDITPAAGAFAALPHRDQDMVRETADKVIELLREDKPLDAYALWQDSRFDADQEIAFWSLIPDSKARAALKALQANEGAKERKVISPAKHKRLEAMIKELGLDRDAVKAFCKKAFNKEHFTELTDSEYVEVDEYISRSVAKAETKPDCEPTISDAEESTLLDLIAAAGMELKHVLQHKDFKLKSLRDLPQSRYQELVDRLKAKAQEGK